MMDREYFRNRRRARRKKFIELLGGKCEKCGSRKDLEFDHKDPSKKEFGVSRFINSPDAVVEKEVMKCQLLCKKCHRKRTLEDWHFALPPAEHGSLWRYKHHGCRCLTCRKAMSDYYYNRKKKDRDMEK